jgi:alpha,alpha-trehalose phosphorylase
VTHATAKYALADGKPLDLMHCGQKVSLSAGKPEAHRVHKTAPTTPRPSQPPGREPARRRPSEDTN